MEKNPCIKNKFKFESIYFIKKGKINYSTLLHRKMNHYKRGEVR